jgi:hypothetical protein
VHGAFDLPDGTEVEIGGKTGTGDNRIEAYGAGGKLIGSRAKSRTATFVFYIGDTHFGVLTAFVTGAGAEHFSFTSALPVQILKSMAPQIASYLDPTRPPRCAGTASKAILAQTPAVPARSSLSAAQAAVAGRAAN